MCVAIYSGSCCVVESHVEGSLPSASVPYNVCNGFFALNGIDVGEMCEGMHALVVK